MPTQNRTPRDKNVTENLFRKGFMKKNKRDIFICSFYCKSLTIENTNENPLKKMRFLSKTKWNSQQMNHLNKTKKQLKWREVPVDVIYDVTSAHSVDVVTSYNTSGKAIYADVEDGEGNKYMTWLPSRLCIDLADYG